MAPNEGNPKGHWEPERVVALHDAILHERGSDLYSVVELDDGWFESSSAARRVAELEAVVSEQYGTAPLIVVKDPRLCLFLPLWHRALTRLGIGVHHVLPLRPPGLVADSLRRRHLKTIPYDAWPSPRGELVWLRYTTAADRFTTGRSRSLLRLDRFFADWRTEARRVAREGGFAWPRPPEAAGGEVDGFLDDSFALGAPSEGNGGDPRPPAALSSPALAEAYFEALADQAEPRTALLQEYRTRVGGAGDILTALEGAYPLIWSYYEESRRAAAVSGLPLPGADDGRLAHRLWRALADAKLNQTRLEQDLHDAERRVEEMRATLDGEAPASTEADEMSSLRVRNLELAQRLDALHASTSWRVTEPVRHLARWLGRERG